MMKTLSRTAQIWSAVTCHRFSSIGDSSPMQGRILWPGNFTGRPSAFDGDKSPAESADKSARSTGCRFRARRITSALLCLQLLALVAAGTAHAKLNLVVTTPDLASVAEAIGGKAVEITTLTRPTEDPHFVDAKPSFVLKLNRADAVLEGGADLEVGWLPALLEQSRNPKLATGAPGRLRANTGIAMLEIPTTLDRSMGDVHAAGNPHFMMDPANARILAAYLADAFCKLDAASCDTYRANLKQFSDELDAKLAEWQKRLAPFAGKRIVAYHNSWPYFGKRFGLNIDLFLEPKPGIPPTPTHMAEVIRKMKEGGVRVVFVEPYLSRRTAEKVAQETGATVVDVTQFPGALKGTAGYIPLMDHLVNAVAGALEKGR